MDDFSCCVAETGTTIPGIAVRRIVTTTIRAIGITILASVLGSPCRALFNCQSCWMGIQQACDRKVQFHPRDIGDGEPLRSWGLPK